jgi:ubiquinone/menaquinone biosynthesis C-methylase UbiE
MTKYYLSALIRKLGLIQVLDKLRFYIQYILTNKARNNFFKTHPYLKLPPPYFLYETYNLNYESFYKNGSETAKWLADYFKKHKKLENVNILDWGCGPGRVIRHLPDYIDKSCNIYGTDYNEKYVKWCQMNLSDIKFIKNELAPPLKYENNFFDIIYGISIFTHLSKDMHYQWFNELLRVLKPNGILFLTLHGDAFKIKLTESEQKMYTSGQVVIKSNTKEGHRTYGAFHPDKFVHELIGNNKILEHVKGGVKNGMPQQDVWIIGKVV